MFMQPAPCEANGLLLGYAAWSSHYCSQHQNESGSNICSSLLMWLKIVGATFAAMITRYHSIFWFLKPFSVDADWCRIRVTQPQWPALASILGLTAPPIVTGAAVPVQAQTELRRGNSVSFIQMSMLHQISIFLKIIVLRYFCQAQGQGQGQGQGQSQSQKSKVKSQKSKVKSKN